MKIEAGASVTPNVRLLRPLGEGGMGAVWVAEHLTLGTEVAVKFLHGEYAEDSNARARFSQEAAASSRVKSAHVVKVHDHGITDTNVPFIVMELLEGTDLSKRIQAEKTIPYGELLAIVSQLCKALARAHESGVIHRDIKPENVFLSSEGGEVFVKLLDFGIAKTEVAMRRTADTRRSTLAGQSLGTPYYMSPEQFRSAKQIDLRSDLWSVGVLVYEALTGVLPFVADTVSALAIVVNEGAAVPPSKINPALPAAIDAWFAKACAHDAKDRFESAGALAAALRSALGASTLSPELDANRSGPRVVISHPEVVVDDLASMRATAFATSGVPVLEGPRRKRPVATLLAVAAVVLAAGTGLIVLRPKSQPPSPAAASAPAPSPASPAALAPPASAAPLAPSSAGAAPEIPAATLAPEPTAPAAGAAPTARRGSPATVSPAPSPHPAPSAPGKPKGNSGDIW
jgi:serine/threonine-protein kinase